ncbi:MAG: hypothetical protein ACI9RU_001526 [Litorivivens sp.]|jgi:hypothetical protein
MLEEVPWAINALFLCSFGLTLVLFYAANGRPKKTILFLMGWSCVLCALAYNHFFTDTRTFPPHFAVAMVPAALAIVFALQSRSRGRTEAKRNRAMGTLMHLIRVPIEIVLFFLFVHGTVPEAMTFAGRNFDVLSGLTAPIVAFLILKGKIGRKALIAWNGVCVLLVMTVLIIGLFSAEFPFQQFAFDQPNRAVMYFPYILLPGIIVPLVIYTHLHDIIVLVKKEDVQQMMYE